ncbi:DNA-binding protein [Aeromicrobium flavum]|uniref:DNA-directed DNA polymerase n=1 Tax=Aeromicrobium flavum TaxID=416568 RepID=A0A512HVF9_9ACTN|nr:DNA-binding protein [Aeromicrobium flavum]
MTYPRDVANPFGKILLITGNSEFLSDRARRQAVDQIRAAVPAAEVAQAVASSLAPGEFTALTSASLFSEATAVVLTDLQDLGEQVAGELLAYAAAPSDDTSVVLIHGGGVKGKGLLDKLRKTPAVSEVAQQAPKYERDLIAWVRQESRDLGRAIDDEGAAVLVAAVGSDLRSLAAAVDQLVTTLAEGERLDAAVVRRYFGGRAEVRGYEIADAALDGRLDLALERARWAEAAKVAPLLITAALASGLRQLARVVTAAPGLRDADLAREIGAPPFKIRALRQSARGWNETSLRHALDAVAHADLQVKGGSAEPAHAVERMIIDVAVARSRTS